MRHPLTLGQQIGYWTIIGFPDDKPEHKHKIRCRCVCGTVRWIYRQTLTNGTSRSCGCRAPRTGQRPADSREREGKTRHE
jgi:hypothetical protein